MDDHGTHSPFLIESPSGIGGVAHFPRLLARRDDRPGFHRLFPTKTPCIAHTPPVRDQGAAIDSIQTRKLACAKGLAIFQYLPATQRVIAVE